MFTTIGSATPHELHFRVEILGLEIAHGNADPREREEKVHPAFPAELCGEARAQPAHFVELRGKKEASLFVEGSARQAGTEEDVVAVIDGQRCCMAASFALG